MSKVIELQQPSRIYLLDICSGCNETITDHYTEIRMPNHDNTQIKHIALCTSCSDVAKDAGVI